MQEIPKEAFHLKNKNKISIEKYQSCIEDEKTNYVPTFTVWEENTVTADSNIPDKMPAN